MAKETKRNKATEPVSLPNSTEKPVAAPPVSSVIEAVFLPELESRRRLFAFLNASYVGGVAYKNATDASGNPVLIEHEGEGGTPGGSADTHSNYIVRTGVASKFIPTTRYERRKRMASYENHVRPIVDKIKAYLLRTSPNRDEKKADEFKRLHIDDFIDTLVVRALRFGECWIGYDSQPVSKNEKGDVVDPKTGDTLSFPDGRVSEAVASTIDPVNKLAPYLVLANPDTVVDFTIDEATDRVLRVVFERVIVEKKSLSSPRTEQRLYIEWDDKVWRVYEEVIDDTRKEADPNIDDVSKPPTSEAVQRGVKIKVIKEEEHGFGVCPWYRLVPEFPIEDVCELNRGLFNISSLLDEELFSNTFTQKWVTGARAENLAKAKTGAGNVLLLEEQEAKVGVFSAVPDAARSLIERIESYREAIYRIVSMEGTATKNVAETDDKKRRDLESLYTLLVGIISNVEWIENTMLTDMGILEESSQQSTYDRSFDVTTLQELQEQIAKVFDLPFVPADIKRTLVRQLLTKMLPYEDSDEIAKATETMIDATKSVAETLVKLWDAGLLTPELAAQILAVPEGAERVALIERLDGHIESSERAGLGMDPNDPNAMEEDDDVLDEETEDDGENEPDDEPGDKSNGFPFNKPKPDDEDTAA